MKLHPEPIFLAICVVLCCARTAAAIEPAECVKLHAQGQDATQAGRLLSAKQSFVECSNEACPAVVREECTRLVTTTETNIPTFVFEAKAPDGRTTKAVEVSVDGKIITDRLRPTAVPIDPGEHVFRFLHTDGAVIEQNVTALEGQKNRLLSVDFSEKKAKAAPKPIEKKPVVRKSGISPATWVFAGVGVAALGSFSYFALTGKKKESELDTCAPRCSDAGYDKMSRDYLFADISLGVAVVAGGIATFIALGSRETSGQVGFRAAPGGGTASLRTRF